MEAAQSSKQAQLALFQEEQKRIEEDIYMPLRLKQGQIEIQPQGIVDSGMDDAVLVALQLVQVGCGVWGWGGIVGLKSLVSNPHQAPLCNLLAIYLQPTVNLEYKHSLLGFLKQTSGVDSF